MFVQSSWNVMAHGEAREGKWRGNWRIEWVASTLHTASEHGVYSISTADAHTSAASSGLNWRPRRFKWTRPFRAKDEIWVSARLPSHFNWPLHYYCHQIVQIASNDWFIMSNGLEATWKEVLVAWFKVLSSNMSGEKTEENYYYFKIFRILVGIRTGNI